MGDGDDKYKIDYHNDDVFVFWKINRYLLSVFCCQGVPVRPLHRYHQRHADVHGLPARAGARERAAAAATARQAVLRHRRPSTRRRRLR